MFVPLSLSLSCYCRCCSTVFLIVSLASCFAQSNDDVSAVSRADVAQVCANVALDPNALNKSFYMSKSTGNKKASVADENLSVQLSGLPADR